CRISCCLAPRTRFGLRRRQPATWRQASPSRPPNWWSCCAISSERRSISTRSRPMSPSRHRDRAARKAAADERARAEPRAEEGVAPPRVAAWAWAWAAACAGTRTDARRPGRHRPIVRGLPRPLDILVEPVIDQFHDGLQRFAGLFAAGLHEDG